MWKPIAILWLRKLHVIKWNTHVRIQNTEIVDFGQTIQLLNICIYGLFTCRLSYFVFLCIGICDHQKTIIWSDHFPNSHSERWKRFAERIQKLKKTKKNTHRKLRTIPIKKNLDGMKYMYNICVRKTPTTSISDLLGVFANGRNTEYNRQFKLLCDRFWCAFFCFTLFFVFVN